MNHQFIERKMFKILKLISPSILIVTCFFDSAFAESLPLSASWNKGLRLESENKEIQLRFGGRLQYDTATHLNTDEELELEVGELVDEVETRRARLYFSARIYNSLDFKVQYDFAGGETEAKDFYIGLLDLGVGNIRIGHFKEPFSLQTLTSSKYITFLERPLTFAPSRNAGVMLYDYIDDVSISYAFGVFRETDGFANGSFNEDNSVSYTLRLANAPIYKDDGAQVFHLGLGYSYRNLDNDSTKFSARPEVHTAPKFIDTGDILSEDVQLMNAELALVKGPFSAEAEYSLAVLDILESGDETLKSWYVQLSYFLTGEHKNYKRKEGVFSRVSPISPFIAAERGAGAWELKARFSKADLSDQTVDGGEMEIVSAGVNWYMHSNAKIMLDYNLADLDEVGDAHVLQGRLALDF